jgi:hypothetical protein
VLVYITRLAGSGKSTVCYQVAKAARLDEEHGVAACFVGGFAAGEDGVAGLAAKTTQSP